MAGVLINGGSRGIGRGICQAFLNQGHRIVFTCRSQDSLEKTIKLFSKSFPCSEYHGIICDSKDFTQVQATVDKAAEILGGIDILVNNAAVRKYGSIYDISIDDWDEAVAINVNGYFYFCKCSLQYLLKSKDAWIFNVGSTAANHPFAGGVSYNTTKAAVHGFSDSMQLDIRNDGIRVCNVIPNNVFNRDMECGCEDQWMMKPLDIGNCIVSQLGMDKRCTPSNIEIKPTDSPKHPDCGIRSLRYI